MDSLDAKGGPFYSYIFYDHHSDRTFHINTLVHNPGKSKAVYIRQMELIAKSFRSIVMEKILLPYLLQVVLVSWECR